MTSRASVDRTYIAIDLKSFYASVECKERNRDPLTTNLVVADQTRTEKTICLAVSPALKSYGIPGRPRLFEVVQKVKEANYKRRYQAPNRTFLGASDDSVELKKNKTLAIDYIVAPPRMAYYMEYSTKIYDIYLKYIAPVSYTHLALKHLTWSSTELFAVSSFFATIRFISLSSTIKTRAFSASKLCLYDSL